jgi:hypothetical protein
LRVLSSSARNVQQKRAKFSTSLIFLSTGCGFFRAGGNDWKRQGRGFRPPRSNRLESRCFEGRNGPKPVVARDSNEIERRRVRAICLAASEQRAVAARRASWARMRSSTTSCGCFIWAVSGRSCPSIRIIMGAPQFTTRASIAPSSGGRRQPRLQRPQKGQGLQGRCLLRSELQRDRADRVGSGRRTY